MGTSKGYGGPPNGLVPSWLSSSGGDDADSGSGDGADHGDGSGDSTDDSGGSSNPSSADAGGFTGARTAFTRFSKNGSSSALGAAMASYVGGNGGGIRSGSQGGGGGGSGARRAMQRMGASRGAGARLLGVVRDFQQLGAADVLRRLDLDGMVNLPAADVFVAMLEFLCPPGGAIDEAISRQAMLEAIGNLDEVGALDFGSLTPDQLREFFLDFVVLSIEGRVIADIGAKGLMVSSDIETLESTHTQLHEFIEGCCRVHLSALLTGLAALSNNDVDRRTNEVYEAAFSLIAEAGEDGQ